MTGLRLIASVLALSYALSSGTSAATRKMTLTTSGFSVFSGFAIVNPFGGSVGLTDLGDANLNFSFALPPNYKKNTTVLVKLRMSSGATNCTMELVTGQVLRKRNGEGIATANGAAGGFIHDPAEKFAVPTTGDQMFTRTFKVKRPTTGTLTSQKPGDLITLNIKRSPADPDDTCSGALQIHAADIIYKTP